MEVYIRHTFDTAPERLWVILRHPEFNDELAALANLDREVLEDEAVAGGRRLRVRMSRREPLAPMAQRALGSTHARWEVRTRTREDALSQEWRVLPPLGGERIRAEGELFVRACDDGGCERVVKGCVEVGIPLVGRRVERQIVTQLARSYDQASTLIRQWLHRTN